MSASFSSPSIWENLAIVSKAIPSTSYTVLLSCWTISPNWALPIALLINFTVKNSKQCLAPVAICYSPVGKIWPNTFYAEISFCAIKIVRKVAIVAVNAIVIIIGGRYAAALFVLLLLSIWRISVLPMSLSLAVIGCTVLLSWWRISVLHKALSLKYSVIACTALLSWSRFSELSMSLSLAWNILSLVALFCSPGRQFRN